MTGCGGSDKTPDKAKATQTEKSGEEGVFTTAINFMPNSLQPSSGNDDLTSMLRPIYETLYQDLKGKIDFYLADDLKVSEDGKTYTIHLNEKANWSDGEQITVDDILFTIAYGARNSGGKSSYNTVKGKDIQFNKKDDKTLEMVLPETYASFQASFGKMTLIPSHAFENDPMKVVTADISIKQRWQHQALIR